MKYYKLIIIGITLFLFNSCKSYDYSIDKLTREEKKFSELPIKVQVFLKNPESFSGNESENSDLDIYYFICLDSVSFYNVETINTGIGPWVDYIKLNDNKNKLSYKIEQGTPTPYIVFDKKLYISKDFNPLSNIKTTKELKFYCYYLKSK